MTAVEVTADGGRPSWRAHPWAWRRWTAAWTATPGSYVLSARAVDATGGSQPREQPWNRGGFGNDLVQDTAVTCVPERG